MCVNVKAAAGDMGVWKWVTNLALALHLIIFIATPALICVAETDSVAYNFDQNDLNALDELWRNWNKSTPDLSTNLPGWSSTGPDNSAPDPCYYANAAWRGVECLQKQRNGTSSIYDAFVVGLSVTDTAVVGTLPPAIGNLSSLVSLTLTGNPSLTGEIPAEVAKLRNLNVLDLQQNNFSGPLPSLLNLLFSPLQELDFSNNHLTGTIPTSWVVLLSIQKLALSSNRLTGSVSQDFFYFMTRLQTLDLSNNSLDGPLPNVSQSTTLSSLDISYNNFDPSTFSDWITSLSTTLTVLGLRGLSLSGDIPSTLLNGFPKLNILALDNNNFTGTLDLNNISKTLYSLQTSSTNGTLSNSGGSVRSLSITNNNIDTVLYNGTIANLGSGFKLQGNPYCNTQGTSDLKRCVCEQVCIDTNSLVGAQSTRDTTIIIIVVTISGFIIIIGAIISALLFWRSQRYKKLLLLEVHKKFAEYDLKPTLFTYSELQKATRDFNIDMKLGEGGYGAVYKGCLTNGSEVAVKQLFIKPRQNIDEFLNEVILLTGVKHRNLVKLQGCCLHGDRRLLVYEFIENNDLAHALFDHRGGRMLTWPIRLNICQGVAQGLHYLHALVKPRIIHRDIKASNILLDKNLQPLIADFGLALLFPDEETHMMTMHIAGTKGYLAPEYATTGQLSEKIDVYSFGVLVLEIVSGRRNLDSKLSMDKVYLPSWAWNLHDEGRLMDLVDPTLPLHTDEESAEVLRVIKIALQCLQMIGDRRPTMAQVITMLQGEVDVVVGKNNDWHSLQPILSAGSSMTSGLGVMKEDFSSDHTLRVNPISTSVSHSGASTSTIELSEILQTR